MTRTGGAALRRWQRSHIGDKQQGRRDCRPSSSHWSECRGCQRAASSNWGCAVCHRTLSCLGSARVWLPVAPEELAPQLIIIHVKPECATHILNSDYLLGIKKLGNAMPNICEEAAACRNNEAQQLCNASIAHREAAVTAPEQPQEMLLVIPHL